MHYRTALQVLMEDEEEKKPVVYLDETWCNAHDGKSKHG